jgi:hypothetical protein
MNETAESQENQESAKTCCCEKNPLHCLETILRDNPARGVWWCLGIGFVLGWKLKSCLRSMAPHRT